MNPSRGERLKMLIEGWEMGIVLLLSVGLLAVGMVFDSVGKVEAVAIGLVFPVAALLGLGLGLREHRGFVLIVGALVCLLAAAAAEEQVTEVVIERSPISRVELRPEQTVTIADAPAALRVEVHGDLRGKSGDAGYRLDLTRGDNDVWINGHIARQKRRTRKGTRISKHLTDFHDVTLAGTGPVRASLASADELIALPLSVEIRPTPVAGPFARWGLVGALIIAALIQALSTRRGEVVQLAAAVGVVGAFSIFVAGSFNPDSPLTFMVSAVVIGVAAGGAAGWITGRIATALFGKRQVSARDSAV